MRRNHSLTIMRACGRNQIIQLLLLVVLMCLLVHLVVFRKFHRPQFTPFAKQDHVQVTSFERRVTLSTPAPYQSRIPNWMDTEAFLSDVNRINADQVVKNADKFHFRLKSNSVVILVQTHDRLDMLKMQLDSFRSNRYINETLLVISHDYYSKAVFDVINTIDFCPVLQIFYPYAIQAYNNVFPGDHPNDCPRDLSKPEARKRKCNNAEYPDEYQHYREAKHTQLKHHWLWKIQFIFERSFIKNVKGVTVLRLDDDYYLAPDSIHFIRKMNVLREKECPECKMYVMGEMDKSFGLAYEKHADKVLKRYWFAGVGRGQAFTKEFWEVLKSCQKAFCLFDDCNWDWSLQHVTAKCSDGGLKVLKAASGRLFHLGECKGFHRNHSCTTRSVKEHVDSVLKRNSRFFFPKTVEIGDTFPSRPLQDVSYGGWADIRDHNLCFKIFDNKTLNNKDLENIHNLLYTVKLR